MYIDPHSAFDRFEGPFSEILFPPFVIVMPYVLKISILSMGSMDIGTHHISCIMCLLN
jgi:hypothetical protein